MYIWMGRTQGRPNNLRTKIVYGVNGLVIIICAFMTVAGMYSAIVSIDANVKGGKTTKPFSCIDNSK